MLANENSEVILQLRLDLHTVTELLGNLLTDADTAASVDAKVAPFLEGSELADTDAGSVEGFTLTDSLGEAVTFIEKQAKVFEADLQAIDLEVRTHPGRPSGVFLLPFVRRDVHLRSCGGGERRDEPSGKRRTITL